MKYCSDCGQTVSKLIPEGDDRLRYVCSNCSAIHYQNPRTIVGTVPLLGDRVLLCRRAIEPRKGFWTLPAGFMENGETSLEGALRETWEEARAKLLNPSLYRVFDLPYINQLYLFYQGELSAADGFDIGPESLEVRLFAEDEIPWDEIAFQVVIDTLKLLFDDQRKSNFPVRVSALRSHHRLK